MKTYRATLPQLPATVYVKAHDERTAAAEARRMVARGPAMTAAHARHVAAYRVTLREVV